MKIFSIFLSALIILSNSFAQSSQKTIPLKFNSYAYKLSVTPKEKLVITTRAGEAASTENIDSVWHFINPVSHNNNTISGELYDQSNFFNNDTGFISGFINSNNSKYNIVRHTTDGGATWKAIEFGQDGWVDDAVNLSNGEAWMSVSGSGIAYSDDYGFNWRKLKIPEVKQRFSSIFFNTKKQGIIGSLWNMIAFTKDNCVTWQILKSPLDQKKYNKTNHQSRPEINKVAIFKNYFVIMQENLVFYSKMDSINWVWLPEYVHFYTDEENTALYFHKNNGDFVRADDQLNITATYPFSENIYDAKCKNGNLFVMCGNKITKLQHDNATSTKTIEAVQNTAPLPQIFGYLKNKVYGASGSKIFSHPSESEDWEYKFTLPFETANGFLKLVDEDQILFAGNNGQLTYYYIKSSRIEKKSAEDLLTLFCSSKIKTVSFCKGSRGCFHNFSDQLVYNRIDNEFNEDNQILNGSQHKNMLPENKEIFDAELVDSFVNKIPHFTKTIPTVTRMGFTQKEYAECRKNILDFKKSVESNNNKKSMAFQLNENNLDFSKLLALVDSVKGLDSSTLNNILFNLTDGWSTTTDYVSINFINSDGNIMNITSQYYNPNSLYFPWSITVSGYTVIGNWIEINHLADDVYPNFLGSKNKVDVLQTIVKRLYK
ncbi:MAG: hypothetical protein ABIU77_10305 [Ferruginibacter sp.]